MVLPYTTEWEPQELLPIAPPTLERLAVAGSGVKYSPVLRSSWLSCSSTMPGCTRAHRSSVLTSSTLFMYLDMSMTMARPTVCPARLVPPPLGSTGTPCLYASSTAAITSSRLRGSTTPSGSIW